MTKKKLSPNLTIAHKVRSAGVKHALFLPELKPVKDWLDEQDIAATTVAELTRQAKEKFPKLPVPSRPSFQTYIDKYQDKKLVVLETTGVDWQASVNKLNEIDFLSDLAFEARRVYDEIVVFDRDQNANKKKKTPPLRGSGAGNWFELARETAYKLNEIKRNMGLYGKQPESITNNFSQFNINSGNTMVVTKEMQQKILEDREAIDDWKERVKNERKATVA